MLRVLTAASNSAGLSIVVDGNEGIVGGALGEYSNRLHLNARFDELESRLLVLRRVERGTCRVDRCAKMIEQLARLGVVIKVGLS